MSDGGTILLADLIVEDRVARVVLSDGRELELAVKSLPPALPSLGEPLGDEQIDALQAAAQRRQVAKAVFHLLDRRLRTRRDLERKLKDRGFAAVAVAEVLDRFATEGLVSDRVFAAAWCRDTLKARAVGRRYLVAKLIAKGVAAALAAEVVASELDQEYETRLAFAAAGRWLRRQHRPLDVKLEAKARRFLAGRGFPHALIGDAIRTAGADAAEAES